MNQQRAFHKRVGQMLVMALIVLVAFIPAVVHGQEVDFDITNLNIQGEVSANGDVTLEETYTYDVGYINGAIITIDYGESPITDYRVGVVNPDTGDIEYLTESYNGSPGTFQVMDEENHSTFTIYYPSENENVEFVLEYTLDSLITNYNDTAELNRRIVGQNIDHSIDVTARILLPGSVQNREDFRAWGHGPPQGEIQPVLGDGRSYIDVTVEDNPPNQWVEVHAIFPTSLTPNNDNIVEQDMKESIIAAENAQVEEDRANYESQENRNWLILILGVLVGPLLTIGSIIYYLRVKRRANPEPAYVPEHVYGLPADITPAVMATATLRSQANEDDFSATIVDLARKGYIEVAEVKKEKRGLFRTGKDSTVEIKPAPNAPDIDQLQKHEQLVLEYIVPDDKPITLDEIETLIEQDSSFRKRQNRLWTRFQNSTEIKGEQIKGKPAEGRNASIGLSVFAVVAGVFWPILAIVLLQLGLPNTNFMIILIVVGVINLIVAVVSLIIQSVRPPVTYEQDKMKKEWRGFANMLDDIGNMNMRELASLPLWEEYLVYAISLGVGDKVLEAMNRNYGVDELEQLSMPYVFYTDVYLINTLMRGSVASQISAAAPASSGSGYSGSNTGGFGGGFSGGSSGGSGGGSGAGGF